MPLDPQKVAELKDWLTRALHDLQAAKTLLDVEPPLSDVAVFHCQQAAEKPFKAFLFWNDTLFRKTHELEELGQACRKIDASLKDVVENAVELTPFAWRFRYPGDVTAPSEADALDALSLAREVYEAIISRLPKEIEI
jgi:HEPN domain-containing protein